MLLVLIHRDFCFDFSRSLDVLLVQVIIDRLHGGWGFAVGPAVLVNDLRDQLMQTVHVVHLLRGDVADNARYLRILLLVLQRHTDVEIGVFDLFCDPLAQFLNDLHNQHTFVTVMFASAIVAADPETTCNDTGEAQQQQELSRSHCTNVVNDRLVPVLCA